MATKQKAVFNLVFDENVIRHQHPEIGYNQDNISYLSGIVDAANIAISANEISIDIIEGDVNENTSAIIQLSGDVEYLSAAIDYVSASISGFDYTAELSYLSAAIDAVSATTTINDTNIAYISGDYVTLTTDQIISANKVIDGNLRVDGVFTTLSSVIITTEEFVLSSNFITLNNNVTGNPSEDAGIAVARGTSATAVLLWDETDDEWKIGISGSLESIATGSDITNINNDIIFLSGEISDNILTIDAIETDLDELSAQIIYLSGEVDNNTSAIVDNDNDIDFLSAAIDGIIHPSVSGDINFLSGVIDALSANDSYLSGEINNNTTNILNLSTSFGSISGDHSALSAAIDNNTTTILTVSGQANTNTINIGTLFGNDFALSATTVTNALNIDYLSGIVSAKCEDIEELSAQNIYLSGAIDGIIHPSASADINYLSGAIDINEANINILSGNDSYLSGIVSAKCEDIIELSAQNIYLSGEIDLNSGDINYLSAVIDAISADNPQVSALSADINYISGIVSGNVIDIQTNITNIQAISAQNTYISGIVSAKCIDIETLSAQNIYLSGAIDNNNTDLTYISGEVSGNNNDIDYLSGAIDGIVHPSMSADINFLSASIDTNTTNITTNSGDIQIVSGGIDYLSAIVSAKCEDIETLSAQNIYLSGAINNLSGDVQYISGEVSSNDDDIASLSAAFDALTTSGIPSGTGISFKSFSIQTDQSGTDYIAGYYDFASNDANLTQGSPTITFGSSNTSYAAHASIIVGGAGTVDTGTVGLRVNGTSINDAGTRIALDSETVTTDITTLSVNDYLETSKKWLGTITFELFSTGGSPTTYSLDFNYGLSKYEDFGNNNFEVSQLEIVGKSAGNDSGFNVKLFHHNSSGWNYSATGFVPGGTEIANLSGSHSPEDDISNSEYFAFKRANLSTFVNGQASEGVVISIDTSTAQVIEHMDAHIGVLGLIAGNDVSGITNDIIYLSGEIDNNTTNITTNSANISNLSAEVQYISGEVASNDFDITYLSGEIDINSTDILSLSTEVSDYQIYTHTAARNNNNATDIYLRGPNGIPTNQAGFMITYDSTIIAIGATTNNSHTWTAEVRKNNNTTPITSLTVTSSPTGLINNLSEDINEGDELQMYCNGSNINRPHMTVYLIRR
jgi:hypothetical protein